MRFARQDEAAGTAVVGPVVRVEVGSGRGWARIALLRANRCGVGDPLVPS
jgi:hypothetical protein